MLFAIDDDSDEDDQGGDDDDVRISNEQCVGRGDLTYLLDCV